MSENVKAKNSSENQEMVKNAMILFVITFIAALLLGLVYQITKDPIAEQEALKISKANSAVFTSAASFSIDNIVDSEKASSLLASDDDAQDYSGVTIDSCIEAYDESGNVLGYVLQITSSGYSDDIVFSMGITNEGVLTGISIISINETPGLGMNAEKVIVPQFTTSDGLDADTTYSVVKDGTGSSSDSDSYIEAISGATITSNAITHGVNAGLLYYTNILEGGQS